MLVVMLPKPTAGFRPIVLLSSLYRLWAQLRKAEPRITKWYHDHDRPYFACGQGRAADTVVWRQAIKQEAARGADRSFATLLWDARKFFEKFSIRLLWERGRAMGFPTEILAAICNMYQTERYIRAQGFYLSAGFARCGLPAGCGWAEIVVRI